MKDIVVDLSNKDQVFGSKEEWIQAFDKMCQMLDESKLLKPTNTQYDMKQTISRLINHHNMKGRISDELKNIYLRRIEEILPPMLSL